MLSADVAVALAPASTYARLVARARPVSWRGALARPLLVLVVLAVATAIAATGRITASLFASAMLLWSWVVLVQLAGGALMVLTAATRRVNAATAVDLFFASHTPWTLWAIGVGMWAASGVDFSLELAIGIGLLASVWTAVILAAFNREVLLVSRTEARMRTGVHQTLIWVVGLSYVAWMSGGWFRLVA